MITVKVTTSNQHLPDIFLRQTPGRKGIWGGCHFIINKPIERCDWWVICHKSAIRDLEVTNCDPAHIVYISMEPTEGLTPDIFFKQFRKLILCDRSVSHPDITYANGTTWWTGIQVKFDDGHNFLPTISHDYDSLSSMYPPPKKNRISVICSNKNWFPGHKKRLQFLEKLQQHPVAEYIDFYGGGHNHILDKLDAILPYKYHLVLENSNIENYWSEKIGDPLLGFALPIYYGCPNINEYLPDNSFIKIDIDNFKETVAILEKSIREDIYSQHLPAIIEARKMILQKYNIFQLMADVCKQSATEYLPCSVMPPGQLGWSWQRRLARRMYHKFRKYLLN